VPAFNGHFLWSCAFDAAPVFNQLSTDSHLKRVPKITLLPQLSHYLNWHLLCEVLGVLYHLCTGSSDEVNRLSPSALQKHVWKSEVY